MAGIVTFASLADGQLPAAKGTLYTVQGGVAMRDIEVALVNTGAVARTINIYVKRGGSSSRRQIPQNMSLGPGETAIRILTALSAGDLIEGDASAATEVDYSISAGTIR